MIICEENLENLRNFYNFRDKLSRMIDSYQINIIEDSKNALNSVRRKIEKLKAM